MSDIKTFADVEALALKVKLAMVQRCMKQGMTMKEAAQELGGNQSWISAALADNGIAWDRSFRRKIVRGGAA